MNTARESAGMARESAGTARESAGTARPTPEFRKNQRILLVDDNRAIHADYRKILLPDASGEAALRSSEAALFGEAAAPVNEACFEVESAYQGAEGVALAEKDLAAGRPFAMAFVDVRMPPGLDGLETSQRLWAIDPHIQIVICTAYSDYSWGEMFEALGRPDQVVILKKPFDGIEALQLAHALTEKWNLARETRRAMQELDARVALRTRELEQANAELRDLADRNQVASAVIQSAAECVMVTSPEQRIEAVNPAFERITGYSAAEAVGRTPDILASGKHDAAFFRGLWQQVEAQGLWHGEMWSRRRTGEIYPQEITVCALRDPEGRVRHYASVFSDDTARHAVEARLRELSSVDGLTGISNRRAFDETLAREWGRALREHLTLSLLIVDVDCFKAYNDRHGHQVGDHCLRQVAQAMARAVTRSSDVVARYGGEEFAVILPGSDAAAAAAIAERVRAGVAALGLPHGASVAAATVTVSIGAATVVPAAASQQAALIRAADSALYEAKRSGRNRVVSDGEPVGRAAPADARAAPADARAVPAAIRILQLEDNADDAEVELRQLRKAGLEFTARRVDARDAFVSALEEFKPDVILADFNVPGFSGEAALQLASRRCPHVPVIMVSGVLTDDQAVEMLKAGARDFVLKDRLGRLGNAVRRVVPGVNP